MVGVADGDTITVLRDNEQVKIRLSGIDAPEKAQAFGNVAKQRMSDMVFGKEVLVDTRKKDKYGRTIGRVWVASAECKVSDCPRHSTQAWRCLQWGWRGTTRNTKRNSRNKNGGSIPSPSLRPVPRRSDYGLMLNKYRRGSGDIQEGANNEVGSIDGDVSNILRGGSTAKCNAVAMRWLVH